MSPIITQDLDLAVLTLQKGQLLAIPTETVYGLAARIDSDAAIQAIFAMKNRPLNHPLIVHVAHKWDLNKITAHIPAYAQDLMHHFWPGPLTLVLRTQHNKVNPLITGGQATVAVRCPSHPLAQKLLQKMNVPLVAPSANPFGKISPTTALHVKESFYDKELLILDGGRCTVGIESTIIDATDEKKYNILRQGLINEQAISSIITTDYVNAKSIIRTPGNLESHYQPQKPLYYFEGHEALADFCSNKNNRVYVIARKKPEQVSAHHYYPLSDDPKTLAFDLYYQLREADASDAVSIAIELPSEDKEWRGVKERILKAGIPFIP